MAPTTWHHGLIARYWDEFNVAEPDELNRYRTAIETFGQPALDVGCGTGRLLLPLLQSGLDVDGTDVSDDMLARCAARAAAEGLAPRLLAQPCHELRPERRYRTVFMCGVFGLGATRAQDREALRRIRGVLEPGGALLLEHELPYGDGGAWERWRPGRQAGTLRPWRDGERRPAADGDELELDARLVAFDPLAQAQTLEMRARLWRDGSVVAEEHRTLDENLYFAAELRSLLEVAGFRDVRVEGGWTGQPAQPDDPTIMFVAHA